MTLGGQGTLGYSNCGKMCYGLSPENKIYKFKSRQEAARHTNNDASNIWACINNKIRITKGWRFSHLKNDLLTPIRKIKTGKHNNHKTTKIYGIHIQTNEFKIFDSLKSAAKYIGIKNQNNISYTLSGRQSHTKKWVFSYKKQDLQTKKNNGLIKMKEHRMKIVQAKRKLST